MKPLYRRIAGLDVHRMLYVLTVLIEKAIIAVAHKMVRTIFILFTRRKAYRDPGIDYQAIVVSKNAPRWIQALKKYGYWPKSASVQTPAPAPTH
jgi:hypothetical protein